MAIRIKDKWHDSERNPSRSKSLEDSAGALAFIGWRLALDRAQKLHREGYRYDTVRERIGVLTEFVAFEVQVVDRLAFDMLDDAARAELVDALGQRLADFMQENMVDIAGPGNYRRPFIAALNERFEDYAACTFADGEPGFDFLRYFGDRVMRALGEDQTNRWVLDQIMAIEAPDVVEQLKKSVVNLLSGAGGGDAKGRR